MSQHSSASESSQPTFRNRTTNRRGVVRLEVANFGILGKINLELEALNVLVGPNGSGKSTILKVFQFLGDAARMQLVPAVEKHGGLDRLRTRMSTKEDFRSGSPKGARSISIRVHSLVTQHASPTALDEYSLQFREVPLHASGAFAHQALFRLETFRFKRYRGGGRRITLRGTKLHVYAETESEQSNSRSSPEASLMVQQSASGLALLPQLGEKHGGAEIKKMQELFTTFRVFDVVAPAARLPARVGTKFLRSDAANLAGFLQFLWQEHRGIYEKLESGARHIVPGFERLSMRSLGGDVEQVAVDVVDRNLKGATPLADASFGTVRALSLLALLHDPAPPLLTCIEEIDHGFHPHVFDHLVDLLREASARTQLLVATHSPALVNRLRTSELTVCERDELSGLARVPSISRKQVEAMKERTDYGLGELWFSGALGGVPK